MTRPRVYRASRRQLVKGVAAASGAAVVASYVRPDFQSLGIPTVVAAVSGGVPKGKPGGVPKGKSQDEDSDSDG